MGRRRKSGSELAGLMSLGVIAAIVVFWQYALLVAAIGVVLYLVSKVGKAATSCDVEEVEEREPSLVETIRAKYNRAIEKHFDAIERAATSKSMISNADEALGLLDDLDQSEHFKDRRTDRDNFRHRLNALKRIAPVLESLKKAARCKASGEKEKEAKLLKKALKCFTSGDVSADDLGIAQQFIPYDVLNSAEQIEERLAVLEQKSCDIAVM